MKCFFCNENIPISMCQQPVEIDGEFHAAHMYCGNNKKLYAKCIVNDISIIVPALQGVTSEEVLEIVSNNPDDFVAVKIIEMTERQYYSLKESRGF